MVTIALIVDWYGPYVTIEKAKQAAAEFGEVLYMAVGKRRYQCAATARMRYVGISTDPKSRISTGHHKLPEITRDFGVWFGEIGSQSIAGRKSRNHPVRHSRAIALAEWVLAYFLKLPLNEKKRKNPPNEAVILI
jgi:hypothetical protein